MALSVIGFALGLPLADSTLTAIPKLWLLGSSHLAAIRLPGTPNLNQPPLPIRPHPRPRSVVEAIPKSKIQIAPSGSLSRSRPPCVIWHCPRCLSANHPIPPSLTWFRHLTASASPSSQSVPPCSIASSPHVQPPDRRPLVPPAPESSTRRSMRPPPRRRSEQQHDMIPRPLPPPPPSRCGVLRCVSETRTHKHTWSGPTCSVRRRRRRRPVRGLGQVCHSGRNSGAARKDLPA
ncbi:hypothetical protein QBC39DRAFT_155274 [Podospora conica]|nr:hypothetical protein QBC39DRAFT_155274 [Schizothecium conicum]